MNLLEDQEEVSDQKEHTILDYSIEAPGFKALNNGTC